MLLNSLTPLYNVKKINRSTMPANSTNPLPVYVLGDGALGSLWACALCEAGYQVRFVVRSPSSSGSLIYHPVYDTQHATRHYDVKRYTIDKLSAQNTQVSQLIVATKSQDVLQGVSGLLNQLSAQLQILLLCNGYGIQTQLRDLLKQHSAQPSNFDFWVGSSSDGALMEKRGHVEHTGQGETWLGRWATATTENKPPPSFMTLCTQALIRTRLSNNIQQHCLQKLFINCAINPLTTIYQCRNGHLVEDTEIHAIFSKLCCELQTVYESVARPCHGNDYKGKLNDSTGKTFNLLQAATDIANLTAKNQSSMLRDYRASRPLELDYLTETVDNLTVEKNIPTPLFSSIVKKIKVINQSLAN